MKALLKKSEIPEILDLQEELAKHIEIPITGFIDEATIAALDQVIADNGYANSEYIQEKIEQEYDNPTEHQDFIRECAINDILSEKYKDEVEKIEKFFRDLCKDKRNKEQIVIMEAHGPGYENSDEYKKFSLGGGMSEQTTNDLPGYTETTVGQLREFARTLNDKGIQRSLRKQNMFEGLPDDQVIKIYNNNTFEIIGGPQRGVRQGGLGLGGSGRRHASEVIFRKAATIKDWKPQVTEKPVVEEKPKVKDEIEWETRDYKGKLYEFDKATGINKDGNIRRVKDKWYTKDVNGDWLVDKEEEKVSEKKVDEKKPVLPASSEEGVKTQKELADKMSKAIKKEGTKSPYFLDLQKAYKGLTDSSYKDGKWDGAIGEGTKTAKDAYEEYLKKALAGDGGSKVTQSDTPLFMKDAPSFTGDKSNTAKTTDTKVTKNKYEVLSYGGVMSNSTIFSKFNNKNIFQEGGKFSPEEKIKFKKLSGEQKNKVGALIDANKINEARSLARSYFNNNSKSGHMIATTPEDATAEALIYDLGSIAFDTAAAFNPEGFSSAAMALTSEALQEMKPGDRSGWDRTLGYGSAALSLVPVIGGAGRGAKVLAKLPKLVQTLKSMPTSSIGKLLMGVGVTTGAAEGTTYVRENKDQLIKDAEAVGQGVIDLFSKDVSDMTAEDWSLMATLGTSIITGLKSPGKTKIDVKLLNKLKKQSKTVSKVKSTNKDIMSYSDYKKSLKKKNQSVVKRKKTIEAKKNKPSTTTTKPTISFSNNFKKNLQKTGQTLWSGTKTAGTAVGDASKFMFMKGKQGYNVASPFIKRKVREAPVVARNIKRKVGPYIPEKFPFKKEQGGTLFSSFRRGGKFIKAQGGLGFPNYLNTGNENATSQELMLRGYGNYTNENIAEMSANPQVRSSLTSTYDLNPNGDLTQDLINEMTGGQPLENTTLPEKKSGFLGGMFKKKDRTVQVGDTPETVDDNKTGFLRTHEQLLEDGKTLAADLASKTDARLKKNIRTTAAIRPATLIGDGGVDERGVQVRQALNTVKRAGGSPATTLSVLTQAQDAANKAGMVQSKMAEEQLNRVDRDKMRERIESDLFRNQQTETENNVALAKAKEKSRVKSALTKFGLDVATGNAQDKQQNLIQASKLGEQEVLDAKTEALRNAMTGTSPQSEAYRTAKNALDSLPSTADNLTRAAAEKRLRDAETALLATDKTYQQAFNEAQKLMYDRANIAYSETKYKKGGKMSSDKVALEKNKLALKTSLAKLKSGAKRNTAAIKRLDKNIEETNKNNREVAKAINSIISKVV